jgi:hypothetical protein
VYEGTWTEALTKNSEGKHQTNRTFTFNADSLINSLNGTYREAYGPRNTSVFINLEPDRQNTLALEVNPRQLGFHSLIK